MSEQNQTDILEENVDGAAPDTSDANALNDADQNTELNEAADIDFEARIAELENELKEAKARANADMYNFQKRIERETENSKKFANERFAKDLLEVIDNLERAIQAAEEAGETGAILDGVMLTHKTLLTTLGKHKVTVIDPAGEAFNADHHEAVGMDPEAANGMVGKVLQKGYQLGERLLRPAMVTVGG